MIPQSLIEEGLLIIRSRDDHALPIGFRRRVWQALANHQVRGRLALQCARRVLPIFETACPNDKLPKTLLDKTEEHVSGQPSEDLARLADRLRTNIDNYHVAGNHPQAVYAGMAVIESARAALYDEAEISGDTAVEDDDVDPYLWDAALYASFAACGDESREGPAKQRQAAFWNWYLEQARFTEESQ